MLTPPQLRLFQADSAQGLYIETAPVLRRQHFSDNRVHSSYEELESTHIDAPSITEREQAWAVDKFRVNKFQNEREFIDSHTQAIGHLGQSLLTTWQAPHPELIFEKLLDDHLQQIYRWFPNQIALATIYIYRETGLLYLERMVGPLQNRVQTATANPAGAAAQLLKHKRPLFVNDTNEWPQDLPPIPIHIARNSSIRAYFSLPLLIGEEGQEETIGVIQVSLTQRQNFPQSWQAQSWNWAQQAAIVLQNARVIRRRRGEEQAFTTISSSAAAGDPDEVATVIAEQVHSLTKSVFVAVLGHEAETNKLVTQGEPIFDHGSTKTRIELDLAQRSINAHVFATGNVYYAPDVHCDKHYMIYAGWDEEMAAAFCVPLIVQNEVIGTIYITSKLHDGIADDDRHFLEKLAPHAAVALHLASLMAEERKHRVRQSEQMAILNRVKTFQADIADILPVDDQLQQIRLALATLDLNTTGFIVATYDPTTELIQFPAVWEKETELLDSQKGAGTRYEPHQLGQQAGLVDYVLMNQQTVRIEDFSSWPHAEAIDPEWCNRMQSCLAIPLCRNERVVGALVLFSQETSFAYSQTDQSLLEAIAEEIAIVIDNAQKYDSVLSALQQSVRELHAVSAFQQEISNIATEDDAELHGADIIDINPAVALPSVEEQELKNIYEQALIAMSAVGLQTGSMYIALYDEQTETIHLPLIYEGEQPVDPTSRAAYRNRCMGDYPHLIEWIIKHREPLYFANRQSMECWAAECGNDIHLPEHSHSWMGAPMFVRNQVIGVLVLRDMNYDHGFRREHGQLLETIAAQAAVVIDNARLYERARRAVRQLHALYQAGQSIAAAGLSLEDVLQAILQQAVRVTGGYFAGLRLAQQEPNSERKSLHLVAIWPPEQGRQFPPELDSMAIDGPGIVPLAYRENRYQLVGNVRQSSTFLQSCANGETRSEIAVVLRQGDKEDESAIGVLNVEHREVDGVTKENHAGVLVGLANLATLAIRNSQQASELEETRDYAIVSEALAWMGIFGAETQHTMAQKVSTMRYGLETLRAWGEQLSVEEQQILLATINDLNKVVNDIQAIAPPDSFAAVTNVPTAVDVELRQSILQWCTEHNLTALHAVEIHFDLACALCQIAIPSRILRIATEKLVHNALKAMINGGELTVRSRLVNGMVQIDICDSGPGIPAFARPDFLKRPIQRRPADTHSGTGMGAHMARIVARHHRGELELVETGAQGTTLRLSFPCLLDA